MHQDYAFFSYEKLTDEKSAALRARDLEKTLCIK
jgi:hypothetical protein